MALNLNHTFCCDFMALYLDAAVFDSRNDRDVKGPLEII